MTRLIGRALSLILLWPWVALAADAAAELIRLVPPDAGLTLTVADLRGQAATIAASTLAARVAELPGISSWLASPAGAQFVRARGEIEKAVGVTLPRIRDDLLGDAFVLTLHVPPGSSPDAARGLLLVRARDRALLARLIDLYNNAELANGSLVEVAALGAGDRAYSARRFKAGRREAEYYRLFDDGTLAWSNSESLLRGVLDRKAGAGAGLGDESSYQKVRKGLPERSLISVHISRKFASMVLETSPKPGGADDDRAAEFLARGLRSVEGIGLAIEWRDGPILHAHAAIDPRGADPRLLRLAGSRSTPSALTRRVPRTAIATLAAPVDFAAAFDAAVAMVPEGDRPRLDAFLSVLRGILLGREVRREILPALGPALIAYVEPPETKSDRFATVGVLELRDAAVALALDNALRTLLSLYALDPSRQALAPRIETRTAGPLRLTTLGGPASFTYAVGPDCLVLGTSSAAVARFGTTEPTPPRPPAVPDARIYASVDALRLAESARTHRETLAAHASSSQGRSTESAARDLDKAIALMDLFREAFFALTVDPELTAVHATIGLIGR